jgi:hypothetical protein
MQFQEYYLGLATAASFQILSNSFTILPFHSESVVKQPTEQLAWRRYTSVRFDRVGEQCGNTWYSRFESTMIESRP